MRDIVERLRRWTISTDAVPASDIMDEAADEIERLRLTDAEREAVEIAVEYVGSAFAVEHHAATLRGLLERTR